MGRKFLCILLIAILVAASFHVSECKKKKKRTVATEPALDESETATVVTRSATKTAAAAASQNDEPAADAAAADEDADADAPSETISPRKPAATIAPATKAAANTAADAEEDAEVAEAASAADADVATKGDDADGDTAEADAAADAAEPDAADAAAEDGAAAKAATGKPVAADDDAAAADAEGAEGTESAEGAAAGGTTDDAAAGGTAAASAAAAEKPSSARGSVSDAGPLAWKSANMSRDDIDPKGPCRRDIKLHCQGVEPGNAVLSLCLTFHVKNEKSGNELGGPKVSKKCKKDVRAFRAEMYKDLSMDKALATACKADITKFCDDDFLYPEPGNVVACLREVNQVEKLADECRAEVLRAQLEAAEDFKMDPQLNQLCSAEADRLCKGVEPGEGRIQECLREHRAQLAWDCQAELFRQEVENAGDIRLNVRLFQACLNDQRRFCADVKYGDARVKDCLEDHRLDPEFSPSCKTEFEQMMARRATDFRLDANLRKYCKGDIAEICYPDAEDISDVANFDAKVIECLQDYREELKDPKCKAAVHRLTARAAESIRFDRPLADACHEDRTTICRDVPDGMAQVFLCLQDNMGKLKESCRTALFEQLVRMAEDIDFKFPMKRACASELQKFCKDIPHGHAARVKCLQESIDSADMGEECRKEVKRDMARSAGDYRLNYRLHRACLPEIQKHCSHACDAASINGSVTCAGTVVKCLQENQDQIESESCKQEITSFSILEAKDPLSLDVPLQAACKGDLQSLCPDVGRDHGRSLACLRGKRDQLSAACRKEEMRFSVMEASDIRITPSLMNACGQELQSFCRDVPPRGGRAFKCLQKHVSDVGMGAACQGEVNLQVARKAANYRLDVRLREECAGDLKQYCEGKDAGKEGHAVVLNCMVDNFKSLAPSCQGEVSYVVRMALFQYHRAAYLTSSCDDAVDSICLVGSTPKPKEINGAVIGVFGQCLLSAQPDKLSEGCRALVQVAGKEGAYVKGGLDQAKLDEALAKLKELPAAAAADGSSGKSGLVISGWLAFAALVAVVVVAVAAGFGIYHKYFSPTRNYTLVVKSAPPGTV
ncbi:unnamed protein product [Closterium sp. NIES-53]